MDEATRAAIEGLKEVVGSLLPAPVSSAHPLGIQIFPERVVPSGIGGLIGVRSDPAGEVSGYRVHARVRVSVRTPDADSLAHALESLTAAIATRDLAAARRGGLLRLDLASIGAPAPVEHPSGPLQRQEIEFTALYEHRGQPSGGTGVIGEIPFFAEVGGSARSGTVLYRAELDAGALVDFEVAGDPAAPLGSATDWEEIGTGAGIRPSGAPRPPGAPGSSGPDRVLLLRSSDPAYPRSDLLLTTEFRSSGGEPGLVFRWSTPEDFYFVLIGAAGSSSWLGRSVGGEVTRLAGMAAESPSGSLPDRMHSLRVAVQGERIRVHLDGRLLLEARDHAPTQPGRAGLACRGAGCADFFRFDLITL